MLLYIYLTLRIHFRIVNIAHLREKSISYNYMLESNVRLIILLYCAAGERA